MTLTGMYMGLRHKERKIFDHKQNIKTALCLQDHIPLPEEQSTADNQEHTEKFPDKKTGREILETIYTTSFYRHFYPQWLNYLSN